MSEIQWANAHFKVTECDTTSKFTISGRDCWALECLSDCAAQRESSSNYSRVICQFGVLRVIVCKADWQWIIQRCDGHEKPLAGARWRALGYYRTQKALIAAWTRLNQTETCETWPELESLPSHFNGDAQ